MIVKRQHNQTKVYIMIGCPGAGKSTWIKKNLEPGIKVVSRDIIRYKLGLTSSPDEKYLGTREEEEKVTLEERKMIGALAGRRKSFVIDDTNLNSKFTKDLLAWLHYLDCYCIGVLVNASWNDIRKRRKNDIPEEALRSLWEKSKNIDLSDFDEVIRVSEKTFAVKTNYSSLSFNDELFAKWRRKTDSILKNDIKQMDKKITTLQKAISNVPGLTKTEIESRQRLIRRAGNAEKLRRILR